MCDCLHNILVTLFTPTEHKEQRFLVVYQDTALLTPLTPFPVDYSYQKLLDVGIPAGCHSNSCQHISII